MVKLKTAKNGFTIIELMVTIFIMTVGLAGISNLIQQTTSFVFVSSSKLTASYLAQEGIEIVRNIGDTNLIEREDYAQGLDSGNWEADYTSQSLTDTYDGDNLNIDVNSFYSYSSGTQTKFKRKITITPTTEPLPPTSNGWDYLKISVQVSWQEKGKPYEVTAEERLYGWRQ